MLLDCRFTNHTYDKNYPLKNNFLLDPFAYIGNKIKMTLRAYPDKLV